jgi:hypothetical protein
MGRHGWPTIHMHIIAAGGFGCARRQQQTGKDRQNGDFPAPQRPLCDDLDHLRTRMVPPQSETMTAEATETWFIQNTHLSPYRQGKKPPGGEICSPTLIRSND